MFDDFDTQVMVEELFEEPIFIYEDDYRYNKDDYQSLEEEYYKFN